MDIGRKADLEYLYQRRPNAVGSELKWIDDSIDSILNENGFTQSMRERLIKETRAGRWDNVRDINEEWQKRQNRGVIATIYK